jgi:hypothetical protein
VGLDPRRTARRRAGAGVARGPNVRHAKFGVGVIVGAEGRGNDARSSQFPRIGA